MIGQVVLQKQISQQIEDDKFPRFSIFVGDKGSGRKTLIHRIWNKELVNHGTGIYTIEDGKIENVRRMIEAAYKMHNTLFCIFDADTMSVAARNALLKVVEECPGNNYFVMTLEDENNTLETIRSRATIYHMDRYTPAQILEYFDSKYNDKDKAYRKIIETVCDTPGDVDILQSSSEEDPANKFYSYVELVVDNIAQVNGANSFKIADKVGLKDEEDKYNLKLFWKMFCKVCIDKAIECFDEGEIDAATQYSKGAQITSHRMKGLRVKGINKPMLFDIWLLDIRKEWM